MMSACYHLASTEVRDEDHYARAQPEPAGAVEAIEPSVGADRVVLTLSEHALCHDVQRGERVSFSTTIEERRSWPLLLGIIGGAAIVQSLLVVALLRPQPGPGVVAAVVAVDAVLAAADVAGIIRWAVLPSRRSHEQESGRTPIARFVGEKALCGGRPPMPLPGRTLRIEATFAGTSQSVAWTRNTDARGQAIFDQWPMVAQTAAYCGAATVKVTATASASTVLSPYPDGASEPAASVVVGAPAAAFVPLAAIRDAASREVATACERDRRARCVAALQSETARSRLACEERCAARVGAAACVFASRACAGDARDQGDRDLCAGETRRCFDQNGVDPADLAACTASCVDERTVEACG